jgi:heme-degrading monooxygenase HmoA
VTIYRIDRFELPESAREELLTAVLHTHELLRQQAGFEYDLLVEEPLPDGRLHVLTVAAWRDEESTVAAKAAIAADRATTGFDPAELLTRLRVTPEFGMYRQILEVTPAG